MDSQPNLMLDPAAQRPRYVDVAERLRELIYRRTLLPGDWIDEPALCQQLAISRTPWREALKVLQQEGRSSWCRATAAA